MISITDKEIQFATKDRRKRKHDQSCELLYGLTCPQCNNVILASFVTSQKVDLWDYEETTILKTKGTNDIGSFNYYYPTVECEKGDSCYESKIDKIPGQVSLIQTLRMKNHILSEDKIGKQPSDRFEVGERPCTLTGTAALTRAMSMKSILALSNMEVNELTKWDWENRTDEIVKSLYENTNTSLREAKSYGKIPIYGTLVHKEKITYGMWVWDKSKYYVKQGVI